jgi:phospholipid/cholesterol/gamma-HCH transport system substrate-binding protein
MKQKRTLHPAWLTLIAVVVIIVSIPVGINVFKRDFVSYANVTLISDRAGLVFDSNSPVKFRGVEVGRVAKIEPKSPVKIHLEIKSSELKYIPANVESQISAPTVFGTKYVDLRSPDKPSSKRLASGAVVRSGDVSIEANTVFQNLVGVLNEIGPAKINAVLAALAEGFRGKGEKFGEAITGFDQTLKEFNPRSELIRQGFRSFKGFNDTYSSAAQNLVTILDSGNTDAEAFITNAGGFHEILVQLARLSTSGDRVLNTGNNAQNVIDVLNKLEPATRLLMKYNPELTCMFQGAHLLLQRGYSEAFSYNGRSFIADAGILFGDDIYRYPDNLPVLDMKGGPGGTPGCGSLPDPAKNFPQRYMITNSGYGTGADIRPNPAVGVPIYGDFAEVSRGEPKPPNIRAFGSGPTFNAPPGPAFGLCCAKPGRLPYPGAPPYGVQRYAQDGTPLWPGLPPPPPPGRWKDPGMGNPAAGSEPFDPVVKATAPVDGPNPPGGPFGPTLDSQQRGPVLAEHLPPIPPPPTAPAP